VETSVSAWQVGFAFPKNGRRPQDRKATWRVLDAAIKKANENAREDEKLRRLTIHSLRHSFASIHLMNRTPIPEVSAMLGHANVNITLTVYIPLHSEDADGLGSEACSGDFQREKTG
jgi:integrase